MERHIMQMCNICACMLQKSDPRALATDGKVVCLHCKWKLDQKEKENVNQVRQTSGLDSRVPPQGT